MTYFDNSLTHFMREKGICNQSTNDISGGHIDGRTKFRIIVSNG